MTPQKPAQAPGPGSAPATATGAAPVARATASRPTAPSTPGRKAWIKKTPVEVVLEQIGKQEEKVADMRTELAREERELSKLQQAKKVLEAL
jgi:hypothetical protein